LVAERGREKGGGGERRGGGVTSGWVDGSVELLLAALPAGLLRCGGGLVKAKGKGNGGVASLLCCCVALRSGVGRKKGKGNHTMRYDTSGHC